MHKHALTTIATLFFAVAAHAGDTPATTPPAPPATTPPATTPPVTTPPATTPPATTTAPAAQAEVDKALPIIRKIAADAAVVKAVKAQNAKKMPMADIKALDEKWIASKGIPDFVKPYLENECAKALSSYKAQLPFVEAFAMDDQGGIVGSIAKTSDYWQGDEDKWTKSFAAGKGAEFVDKPKFDESSQTYSVQVSVPVLDGGKAIGAITVAIAAGKK